MSFLVGSFLSLIPFFFRHHRVFSEVRKHSVLVFFKKVPNAALYTCRSLRRGGLQRENGWQKSVGSGAVQGPPQACRSGKGWLRPAALILQLPSSSGNATASQQRQETEHPHISSSGDWRLAVGGSPVWSPGTSRAKPVRVALSAKWPESCFPSSSAEGGGGGGFKHQFRPAWWHQSVWMQIRFQMELVGVNGDRVQQTLKCSFHMCRFAAAAQCVCHVITPTQCQN